MESYQQPHHGYMRPPPAPPSMGTDPNYPHHQHHPQQQYPPPPPPPPPQQQPAANSWYPGQFQYHPSHSPSPPPPPPPPQQNQWGPPPPHPPPPYHAHPHQPYPAPQPYPPPPPPPSYPNQEWGNGNWTNHSGWEYPAAHSNEEDWAAKAKAWASSRSATENQQPQPQYTSVTRQEDPSSYANQYSQPPESHYQDVQQTSAPTPGFSSYQGPVAPLHRPPAGLQQEPSTVGSYAPDSHLSFASKDGALGGDRNAAFAHQQGQTSSSVHQQEVPSSYSSIPGYENGSRGMQYGTSLPPADGRVMPDHAQFGYGNHLANSMDQPLEFSSRYSHENDPKVMSSYPNPSGPVRGTDSVAAVSSLHSWTAPVGPGVSYPPMAPAFPSALQHDPACVPPLPGQHSPLFGTGPGFQPPVPSITTPMAMSAGMALHPAAAFPVDAYGAPMGSERPKKAAVPNWLREEIIKTKATVASSATDHLKEGSQSVEDELIDRPMGKGDQDSKSMDSARSTEEEDDDEDEEDTQRTAAINQEIKRVLTEVLLKVTDELFDEIATRVLGEDDPTAKVVAESDIHVTVPGVLPPPPPPPPPVLAPKASAKVIIPVKAKEYVEQASVDSSSESPGNVLGLANYASDEDDEIQASSVPKSDSGVHDASVNGRLQIDSEEHRKNQFMDEKGDGVGGDASKSPYNGREETLDGPDVPVEKLTLRRSARDDSQERGDKRHGRKESKRSSSGRDKYKEIESRRVREAEKDEHYSRRDERHKKKDKTEDSKREKEKDRKERSPRHGEKTRESDTRKRSPHREIKDSKSERERDKKRSGKDDGDKRIERSKEEKNDKSRHKSSESGRHKRRRSSSVGSRGKPNEDSSVLSDGSSDETSEDSRRKDNVKRRNLSPSLTRSRRRQVSRSPHSKHTQQRHSPYSSLDGSRERKSRSRSRSRSPVRRHRR